MILFRSCIVQRCCLVTGVEQYSPMILYSLVFIVQISCLVGVEQYSPTRGRSLGPRQSGSTSSNRTSLDSGSICLTGIFTLLHLKILPKVHPCATADIASQMLASAPRSSYLLAFLSLYGQALGLTVSLEYAKKDSD